jgi:hypothetical protein
VCRVQVVRGVIDSSYAFSLEESASFFDGHSLHLKIPHGVHFNDDTELLERLSVKGIKEPCFG